jgi:hypothetical protein
MAGTVRQSCVAIAPGESGCTCQDAADTSATVGYVFWCLRGKMRPSERYLLMKNVFSTAMLMLVQPGYSEYVWQGLGRLLHQQQAQVVE